FAAQVDIELASNLQIVGGPWISHRVEKVYATPAGNSDQGVSFGLVPRKLHGCKMHAGQGTDYLQVTQFLSTNVHQQVFAVRVLAVQTLDRVLHCGRELSISAAELFQKHDAKTRIR